MQSALRDIILIMHYTFSAKEKDSESGYTYFGARYYSDNIMQWLSVDPMSDMRPGVSPYSYCQNNPIGRVDTWGMLDDEWEIDKAGKIVNHIETTKHDAFYMVDDNGNRIGGKSVEFEYGTIENYQSQYSDQAGTTFDWYNVRGDENGDILFKFLAKNTSVEFSKLMLGQEGDKGLNIISTSHEKSKERSIKFLLDNQYKYGYTLRGHIHNHPGNTPYPSGLDDGRGDIGFANYLTNISLKNGGGIPSFNIYLPKTGKVINYNRNSNYSDFPNALPTIKLPEVNIVTSRKK